MEKIKIKTGNIEVEAEFNSSKTAQCIFECLPIDGRVNLWGDEIYFEIPVTCELEEDYRRDIVDVGDVAYWPDGRCFCIFFGPTPISEADKIRPASSVTLVGKITKGLEKLKEIKPGQDIQLVHFVD